MSEIKESPAVVFFDAYYKGFHVSVTKRDSSVTGEEMKILVNQQLRLIDWMIEECECKPSWNSETNAKQTGIPPIPVTPKVSPQVTVTACRICGATATERRGTTKAGKPYHGIFCSTEDKTHTRWLWDASK
jgi:hypothetical protein